MPEPVTITICAAYGGVSALGSAGSYLCSWWRGHAGSDVKTVEDLNKERIKVCDYLRRFGWHCSTAPCVRFLQVVPQEETSLLQILADPVFRNSDSLKTWMQHQLNQALKLKVGTDDLKAETVHSFKTPGGKFASMMAVIFVRALPSEESTISSMAKETPQEVCDRLKKLGSKYHGIANMMQSDGIDGSFLASNDISSQILAEEYGIQRKLQQDILLHHFRKYKPTIIPNLAIGVAACSAEFFHKQAFLGSGADALSHEDIKVRAQKIMAYQSASKILGDAEPQPHAEPQPQTAQPALQQEQMSEPGSSAFEPVP